MDVDREVRTICPYCGVGCGLVLRVGGGRLVGAVGDASNVVNRGALCPKGATAHEFVHHPDRLTTPLRRVGGELAPCSWEDGYRLVAEGLRGVIESEGPDACGLISSARATVEENYLAQKFARVVLGTNQLDQCFRICHSASVEGLSASLGSGGMTNALRELEDPGPRAILIVGNNTPHSHPIVWSVWVRAALDKGARLVVIDPRRTDAAKRADIHLAPRPGTEVALFNAMAHHILANNLQDDAFLRERCEGREAFEEAVAACAPDVVADLCGLSADGIRAAAEAYAREGPAMILYGLGVTEHRNGVDNVRALANLALITGNVGRPGAGINALRGQNDVQGATDVCRPESLPGYQSWKDPAVVAKFERAWGVTLPAPQDEFLLYCSRMWEKALEGELRALYVIGSDPALTEGNRRKVRQALESLDFLVVQDLFLTETGKLADIVLPSSSYAEKDGTFVNTERRVQRVRQAIPPVGDSRPDWRILVELAESLGKPLGVASPEEAWEEMRALTPIFGGITYARIEAQGIQWPCPDEAHPGTETLHVGRFARGKARLAACSPMAPAEEPDAEYPFILTTGRTFLQYNCGSNSRRTRMERGDPESHVELCAEDASELGIRDGDRVKVETRRGAVEVVARVRDIAVGVVWMPFHFAEAPANDLTSDIVDPECGITELKACAARLRRA